MTPSQGMDVIERTESTTNLEKKNSKSTRKSVKTSSQQFQKQVKKIKNINWRAESSGASHLKKIIITSNIHVKYNNIIILCLNIGINNYATGCAEGTAPNLV